MPFLGVKEWFERGSAAGIFCRTTLGDVGDTICCSSFFTPLEKLTVMCKIENITGHSGNLGGFSEVD